MTTATASHLQAKQLTASLTVDDVQKSITFFEGLGFGILEKWEKDGKLLGVMMKAGDVEVGLSQDDWGKGRDRKKGVGLYISTAQNVDDLAKRAKENGVTLSLEPHDTDWGARAFQVIEPTGFRITIVKEA
jgi:uncharacterized glyoxalase superfamily protein PhnB